MMHYGVKHHLSCDIEPLELAVEGEGSFYISIVQRNRVGKSLVGGRRGRRRRYTLCDIRVSIRKQGNSLKLVNYKSAMPSM